ncbi:hypothetical protein GCM10023153_10110 [Ornithinibacter aureus]|uniref:Restriction endonuclease type IV Mrr domain-containing protein n=1 Tax=Ornithinibacter aureus TaxID=622664 RepID=A0ABP8JJB1_9MICO|nr:hypothetical protein [Ornithinibacter aureus]KAF0833811.1 hypothetical protein C8E84_1609 [Ornithinibacter aureus]
MLRDVVRIYLDTLTEREFDGPLLALLDARGFKDVHFIHGAFEFGKDVLAKRVDPETGEVHQYLIQSKAGDIGMPEWRGVRPQLDECQYNTIGHPSFDPNLPRVAVLVTTGRLKGAAPADAAEYRKAAAARGDALVEIWENSDLIDWMLDDPTVGVAGGALEVDLLKMVTSILDKGVNDRRIESYGRRWLAKEGSSLRATIESAILVNTLLRVRRLDLAMSVALQLVRCAEQDALAPEGLQQAARRLVCSLASQVRDQMDPLLDDPLDVARYLRSEPALLTYPVICCRAAEAVALGLAVAREQGDSAGVEAFQRTLRLLAQLPGAARPVSDLFASSVIATTLLLSTYDHDGAVEYLRRVAKWVLDRHDEAMSGLGLAGLGEDEEVTAARLLGGSLSSTTLDRRPASYLATAVLDLALFLDARALFEAVRESIAALRIVPEATAADEATAQWTRGGEQVWPVPRVDFLPFEAQVEAERAQPPVDAVTALLLTAACRSRHYPGGWAGLATAQSLPASVNEAPS